MIRVLLILALIAVLGVGFAWIADRPGDISVTWQGIHYETSLVVGFIALLALVVVLSLLWSLIRLVFRIPGIVSIGRRLRRREKALRALTRGMIAAGAGDTRTARRAAHDAEKHLPDEPLTLLLKAQAAQLSGDRAEADRTFARMAERPETRLLGLRGLHVEARRRGDLEAAQHYATEAHALAPVDWAGRAVLEYHSAHEHWDRALAAVDANQAHKLVDRRAANRQRAVIKTAQAIDLGIRDPDRVIELAREAVKLAPELVPAIVVAGRTLSRRGDIRAASKVLEAGWKRIAHPEIAAAYLEVRPGDSARDRLARAETLARIDTNAPESRLIVARAALEARDFARAREVMTYITGPGAQPTRRMCLLMADIEETENGSTGALREWLGRAARAPRDAAWIADGVVSDVWAPVSPVTGRLDAFEWKVPDERLSQMIEPMPDLPLLPDGPQDTQPDTLAIEHDSTPPSAPPAAEPVAVAPPAAPVPEPAIAPAPEPAIPPAPPPDAPAAAPPAPMPAAAPPGLALVADRESKPAPSPDVTRKSSQPRPVLFPQPIAPDDPGPRRTLSRDDESFA